MWARATGTLRTSGTHEEVQWVDGSLSGTPAGMAEFNKLITLYTVNDQPMCMAGGGPCSFENHLQSPWAVIVAFEAIFVHDTLTVKASPDYPSRKPLPKGAIG